ncbi:lipocalin-like domain-containing protein [Sphingomonas sp. RHCKR7]|nr:lipocalin-like domain-containing protein [Sphingomonas folli]
MISATLEEDGRETRPYGLKPAGMLVFTPDFHFVEVLTNSETPHVASGRRGEGTDSENREAMTNGVGFFGAYSVRGDGTFSGNVVEGATFPNWVGSERTTHELLLEVRGSRLTETFTRPGGGVLRAAFVRVRAPANARNT